MKRRDSTEREILQTLRQVGADYVLLDPFDILCLWRGRLHMMDCKTLIGRRTVRQQQLVDRGWPLHFVVTPQDALAVLGLDEKPVCRVCGGYGFIAQKRSIDDGFGEVDTCPACEDPPPDTKP